MFLHALGEQRKDLLLVRVLVPTNCHLHVYDSEGNDKEVRCVSYDRMEPFQYYNAQW